MTVASNLSSPILLVLKLIETVLFRLSSPVRHRDSHSFFTSRENDHCSYG